MSSNPVNLILRASTSDLVDHAGKIFSMTIGPDALSHKLFKNNRPTSIDIEYAIEYIENCVMPLDKLLPSYRSTLRISNNTPDVNLENLLGNNPLIHRDEFEVIFNQSLTQERSAKMIAALLIIRECLHHQHFVNVSMIDSKQF